jgi:hypothetical protein
VPALARILAVASLLACSCAEIPNGAAGPEERGMVEVTVRTAPPRLGKSARAAQTSAANLVVEVGGADIAPVRFKVRIDPARPVSVDTVRNVPIGKNRRISIWAVNKDDSTTHIDSTEYHFADIENGMVSRVSALLIPAAGSIYLMLYGLEGSVAGVHARFSSLDGKRSFENYADKAARTFLHIDDVPHNLAGVLRVSLVGERMDTVKTATQKFTFDARRDSAVTLRFVDNSGMLGMNVALQAPGVTMASYNFKTSASEVDESGELIITEIMYSAGDDNYIELHNPQGKVVIFDTLTTDIDGTTYSFPGVAVEPKGYLVIGRRAAPYVNLSAGAVSGLPIVSTGNWIAVRRGKSGPIIDRVICGGTNSAVGWPVGLSSSSKRSAELNRDKYGAAENNFGKNWTAASRQIDGTNIYGTPGK